MRFAFAGDRDVAVSVLDFLLAAGARPAALMLSGEDRATHAEDLARRCDHLDPGLVFRGGAFREPDAIASLSALDLDLIIGVHFPYLVPQEVLEVPRAGVVNLHPAYLPFNRGWHTPSWALLEGTPIGATLHFMDVGVDTGDIIHRRRLEPTPGDTADSLYRRLKALEVKVFAEAWPSLAAGTYSRTPQAGEEGTFHRRADLHSPDVQRLDLDRWVRTEDLLRRLRGLTTNRADEAAYFEAEGRRYRVQVSITEEPAEREG